MVVEVRYDHVTGDRFRHGSQALALSVRDKAPRQCTCEQLDLEGRPGKLVATILGADRGWRNDPAGHSVIFPTNSRSFVMDDDRSKGPPKTSRARSRKASARP
jgi:hypothetical protein